jgi:hypothetical protein
MAVLHFPERNYLNSLLSLFRYPVAANEVVQGTAIRGPLESGYAPGSALHVERYTGQCHRSGSRTATSRDVLEIPKLLPGHQLLSHKHTTGTSDLY